MKLEKNNNITYCIFTFNFCFILFISSILFSIFLEHEIKQKIIKSTVIIEDYVLMSKGSGLVVLRNGQKYILTNNHVCKKDKSGVDHWAITTNEIKDKIVVFDDNKHSDKTLDVCFVQYNGVVQGYNLDRTDYIFKIYDILPFKHKDSNVYHYTRIRNQNDDILINKGKTGDYIYSTRFETTNSDYAMETIKKHSNIIYLKIISGDSGSPLFYKDGKMEGVVFAQKTKDKKKRDLTRKEEEKLVLLGFYTKFKYFKELYNRL